MKSKPSQLPLPDRVIEVRKPNGAYEKVAKLPEQGHVRIIIKKGRPDAK